MYTITDFNQKLDSWIESLEQKCIQERNMPNITQNMSMKLFIQDGKNDSRHDSFKEELKFSSGTTTVFF